MRNASCTAAAFLASVILPTVAGGGAPRVPPPLAAERIADGVYAIVRHTAPDEPSDANTTIIVNERDVVVVDANITPVSSRAVIAAIRRLTPKPVRYVVNTHLHSDHVYGNMAYADAYPGVEFIGHAVTRAEYLRLDPPALARNVTTDYPATIERDEAAIARGTRRDGTPYTAAQLDALRQEARSLRAFLADMRGFRHVPPDLTVTDSLVIHRGERRIVVRHVGRAHTAGDLVVYLPRERVLATGDVVVAPIPFVWEAHPREWIAVLDTLRTLPVDVIVPGHGDLQRDWRYVDRVAGIFRTTLDAVRAAASDAPLDSVRRHVTLEPLREAFIGARRELAPSFDAFADVLIERAYLDVRGRLPD